MPNTMMILHPYKHQGDWMFDDDRHGLVGEPFVAGMGEIIDRFVRDIPRAQEGFRLTFSMYAFPGAQEQLMRVRPGDHGEGNWYRWDREGLEGWLCPALLHYFEQAPAKIYVRADAAAA